MDDANGNIIQYHVDHQGIAVLRVNRSPARNALNWSAQQRFADLITTVSLDSTIRALIITGSGNRAFVSGGDLKELIEHPERAAGERLNRVMSAALSSMTGLPIPVIAAINGDAFGGGCEIVTACDLRIAAGWARFSFAQVPNGLTTGWGGTGRLIRLVGQSRALELLLTARLFSAEEARRIGLVHRVVSEQKDVLESALIWANDLIALPRKALAATKALVYAAGKMSLTELNEFEADQFVGLWDTSDHKEALAAFQQKRLPLFNQDWSLDALE
jgi:enoyl-CoA hydratase